MEGGDYIKPTSKELPPDWGRNIHGKLVTFGEGENMAWGIEVNIPITEETKSSLIDYGFAVKNLRRITILDLSPQESLRPNERTIRSKSRHETEMQRILDSTTDYNEPKDQGRATNQIIKIFVRVMGNSSDAKNHFNETQSDSEKIAIVIGHGGG